MFSKKMKWGAATAAYQIEGAHDADGKGPSIWDVHSAEPGAIANGDSGAIACDHYHRYRDDVALMKQIGLQAYRFSLSWPRLIPEGTGAENPAGWDFYDRLVDELLAAGIEPWITVFHWDLPHALYCRGGWLNRDSADWFADYAEACVKRFGDRVRHWMTLNEPQCIVAGIKQSDNLAPALTYRRADFLRFTHNLLRAHAAAVPRMRAAAAGELVIGWAPVGVVAMPEDPRDPKHVEAARSAMFSIEGDSWWNNTWYADPVLKGEYPADGLATWGPWMPKGWENDLATMMTPIDFYGANIYNGRPYRPGPDGRPVPCNRNPGFPHSRFDWAVEPESLYWGPRFYHERYGLPIVVTENGISCHDWAGLDGAVHDPQRVDFLARYLAELERAAGDGIPIEGYFAWSLMDNFEWAKGYRERFGLIHVDFTTQKRTPKDSAWWYRDFIAAHSR